MEYYQKQQKKKPEETKENEIKVAGNGQVPKYLSYALRILKHSDKYESITIRASGNAIVKAMQIVELIKRKIGNLH
jgi:ribonucleases P/MRP protein subunit RPP25